MVQFSEIKEILEPQLGYLAKSNGEQLLSHHYTVWSVLSKIAKFIPSLDERERYLLELSALLHDVGKMSEENQQKLRKGFEEPGSFKIVHKMTQEELNKYFEKVELLKRLSEEERKFIYDVILTHHSVSRDDLRDISTPSAGIFTELLRYADHLGSMERVNPNTIARVREALRGFLDITYFQISRFPSPTTYLFLEEGIKAYREKGWDLLLVFDNAAVFIGEKGLGFPNREDVVRVIEDVFFNSSLKFQSVYNVFTKCVLGGLSCTLPAKFMEANKDRIVSNLGNVTKKGGQFFRLLQDLYALDEREYKTIKNRLPFCDLIQALCGSSGHPRAKGLWKNLFKEEPPDSFNENALTSLLSKISPSDIIPDEYLSELPVDRRKKLDRFTPEELFQLLYHIARRREEKVGDYSDITRYVETIMALEEKANFKELAKDIFDRYKSYKRTKTATKGACERCGCPVALEARPVLGYGRGEGYGFSQIKADPSSSQATCLFCAYDNMVAKGEGKRGSQKVLVRVETKVPELWKHYRELDRLIKAISQGVRYPHSIVKIEEKEELRHLPFGKRLRIPLSRKEYEEEYRQILRSEHGVLFSIGNVGRKEGVKNLRAKYEPLYHALNLLGFTTSIGLKEQIGLFGESVVTTTEAYYNSLAVILLARAVKKGNESKFLFAKELIEKSPSVALRCASEEDKKGASLLNKDQLMRFYQFLYKGNIKVFEVNREVYSMRNLLKDAAFFADKEKGIPHFCIEPENRGDFWVKLTRHSATKPIAQALDEIMMGREFDFAMERFLRNIATKIPKEEQDELKKFVAKTKEVLSKYHQLRQEDISKFIRARNALTSAIYVFTRYSNLKEVINE